VGKKSREQRPFSGIWIPTFERAAGALLPHMKITDLLLEVDRWTGFSRHLTRVKTGQLSPCDLNPRLRSQAIHDLNAVKWATQGGRRYGENYHSV